MPLNKTHHLIITRTYTATLLNRMSHGKLACDTKYETIIVNLQSVRIFEIHFSNK